MIAEVDPEFADVGDRLRWARPLTAAFAPALGNL